MSDPLISPMPVQEDGLDHIFTHGNAKEQQADAENEASEMEASEIEAHNGLTVAQTALLLGFDQSSVLKAIRQRKICAARQKGLGKWAVDLECVRSWLQKLGCPSKTPSASARQPEAHQLTIAADAEENDSMRTLWYKLDMAGQQLRAASYRIGYLESQVDIYKQQAAALPDLQAQAARASRADLEVSELKLQLEAARAECELLRLPWWRRFTLKQARA